MHRTLAALLAVMFIACAPADDTPEPAQADVPVPAAAEPTTVHVVLNEWSVQPSEATLNAGSVRFHAMNEGQHIHSLEVERQRDGEENDTGNIPAGGTGEVTVNLEPGTYTLYCPREDAEGNHRARGMETTLTVR
jgi:plastocyanin